MKECDENWVDGMLFDENDKLIKIDTTQGMFVPELKLQKEIDRLKEGISYALVQEDLDYGMVESEAIQFRMRKVFSILLDLTDGKK